MIEVNLLPPEFRRKKIEIFAGIKVPPVKVILATVAVLIIIQIFIGGICRIQTARLSRLSRQWKKMEPSRTELDGLTGDLGEISNRVKVIDELILQRFLWAEKLNQLSNLVSEGIWLRELRLTSAGKNKKQPALIFRGTAFSRSGDEPAVIAKFMKELKESRAFYNDFKDIELGTLIQRDIKGTGVMDFTLTCYFKPQVLN